MFITVIGLGILMALGFWQLSRADVKRDLLEKYAQNQKLNPQNQLPTVQEALDYQPVTLTGEFINHPVWLLDNKFHHSFAGYHVLTPFLLKKQNVLILVNRGFIPRKEKREQMPHIEPITGEQTISGLLHKPSAGFTLGVTVEKPTPDITILQTIDIKQLSAMLNKPLYPDILLLNPDTTLGFVREWNPVVMSPQRHLGYAVQWFALAFTLLILSLISQFKRKEPS